jgi:pimeloyl-ACP methyl ester carboxylesterase
MDSEDLHYPRKIPNFNRSYALLSSAPEVAVIFVHGFDGDARKTWLDFQHLIDKLGGQFPLWKKCDLFFFSYSSRNQIVPLAEELVAFINYVVESTRRGESGTSLPSGMLIVRPDNPPSYKNCVLVGHSTGAVIIREAVLQLAEPWLRQDSIVSLTSDKSPEREQIPQRRIDRLVLNSGLRFFAPAHIGVIAAGKLGLLQAIPILNVLADLHLRKNPLYQVLKPGGPALLRIQHETENLHERFPDIGAFKAQSLFGHQEEIVVVDVYKHESKLPTEPGHSHTSICKPTLHYTRPLEFVLDAIYGKAASQ